jgi:cytochrome c oxidase subunit 2
MNPSLSSLLAQAPTTLPTIAPGGHSLWMPPQASTGAPPVDAVFYFILGISTFFFILIVALMVWFVLRYRQRRAGETAPGQVTHHTGLELTWSAIPLVLVVIMFYMGFRGFMDMVNPPVGAEDIRVLGQKWKWFFTYPNGHTDTELHVPVDRPIRLILESNDVIHSLWIPAFRIKRDAVPGRYNKIWFQATQPGDYAAVCAEYCGTQHSDMLARVVVHEPGMYEKWLNEAADPFRTRSLAQVGELLVTRRCLSCHSVDGSANIGPTLQGIYEHPVKLADGSEVIADDNYIRESILYPSAKLVAGYGNQMTSFKGLLKDREITAIIEYIKKLSGVEVDDAPPAESDGAGAPVPATQPASDAQVQS